MDKTGNEGKNDKKDREWVKEENRKTKNDKFIK